MFKILLLAVNDPGVAPRYSLMHIRYQFVLALAAIIAGQISTRAQEPGGAAGACNPNVPLKLLFSSTQDLFESWGQLRIGVTPVNEVRQIEKPEFSVVSAFPQANGTYEVFGQEFAQVSRGKEIYDETNSWKLIRAMTSDGVSFQNRETVINQSAGTWTRHAAIAYNPDAKEYLLLKLKMDSSGFGYTAFFSADGKHWQRHSENPLFYDGDAMSLFWSPVLKRFVCVSKSLQPYRKHIRDHGGTTLALHDETLRDRRVLMIRTSANGRQWDPPVSLTDVWDRHGRKTAIAASYLTVPDADDPPDLEFYSGNAFWYFDRAYMMVLNYAASPLKPSEHGPHLDHEWWTSPDGLHWSRPAREVNALDAFPKVMRLECPPLLLKGMILFPQDKYLLGLREDRISFVTARANGEFSTSLFTMPKGKLRLNAAVPAPQRPFAANQAYLMAALVNKDGRIVPGFEAENCIIRNEDRCDIPLQWTHATTSQLVGETVRLRFFLRGANIYAVTADAVP
jgi:hypothetical protein